MRIGIGKYGIDVSRSVKTGSHPVSSDTAQLQQLVHMFASEGKPVVNAANVNRGWWFAGNRQVWGRGARVPLNLFVVRPSAGRGAAQRSAGYLFPATARDDQEWVPVGRHPFQKLVQRPNADEDGIAFHARQLLSLQDAGKYYVAVYPEWDELTHPDKPGLVLRSLPRIREIRLLEWDHVQVHRSAARRAAAFTYNPPHGGPPEGLAAPPATQAEIRAWRREPYAFAYRVVHPTAHSYDGASPSYAATTSVATSEALGTLNWNQVKNGLHSGLIFFLKKVSQQALDAKVFEKVALGVKAGIRQAGAALVLGDDVTVQENPLNNTSMGFKDLGEMSRQQQLAIQGVSDGIIGLGSNVNRSTLWALEHLFATGTIDPLNALIAGAYNRWLLPLYSGQSDESWFECIFESSRMVDEKDQADVLLKLTGGKPIYTQNEAREKLGMPPHPDGDKLDSAKKELPAALAAAGKGAGAVAQQDSEVEAGKEMGDAGRAGAGRGLELGDLLHFDGEGNPEPGGSGVRNPCGCGGHAGKA